MSANAALAGLLLFIFMLSASLVQAAGRDDDFLAARDAYKARNASRLNEYASRLAGYPLESYVAFWQLALRLDEASPEEVHAFLSRFADSPLADRLRGEWLKVLGKQQNWDLFSREYPLLVNEDKTVTCYALQARLLRGDKGAYPEARGLWFDGSDLPSNCSAVFDTLAADGQLTVDDVWARIRLALEAGNVSVAKSVAQYLPAGQTPDGKAFDAASDNPQRFLGKTRHDFKSRSGRELVMFALYRVARSQPALAEQEWQKVREHFSPAEQGYVWGQLAYQAARKHDPIALQWFRAAGNVPLTDNQLAWRTRMALRVQDWQDVLASISAMSDLEQRNGAWRYWKARALKETGKVAQANSIFAPLSREYNFYGLLANEELGAVAGEPLTVYKASDDDVAAIKSLPGIQRALALYHLDMRYDANREWVWATRDFDDRHLLAAAELARRNDWIDRAINTADKTTQLHDFSLRYLAPHRDVMETYTRQLGLDEAWVYGLIRQESRFVSQAKSSVGASGMMQLMPTTARWVAKRMGMKDYSHRLVNEIETNIALGTYYLKHVNESLGGYPVLATAAYNAGPARARRWRDDKAMEGAVYAESIPFNETRDYVKKVMSNAMYYGARFGQQLVTLKQRLGIILGGQDDSTDDDGP